MGLHLQVFDSPLEPLLELLIDSNLSGHKSVQMCIYATGLTESSQQKNKAEPVYLVHTVQS